MRFSELFKDFKKVHKTSKTIFDRLKPQIKSKISKVIYGRKKYNKGPKISIDLDRLLDALLKYLTSGITHSDVKEFYQIRAIKTKTSFLKVLTFGH